MDLGVVQNCHHFQKSTQSSLGGGGQWPPYIKKNVDYVALHFHTVLLKINIFKVLFWEGGGHKKEYSDYAFDNVDNYYGRPLHENS